MKYIGLGVIYLVAMWLTVEASTAVSKKLATVLQIKKQLNRFGIKGKLGKITVEKEEGKLLRDMLNFQKALIVGSTALATDICTLNLTYIVFKDKLFVMAMFVSVMLLCVTFGQRLASRKLWAVEGCSKLIALSSAKVNSGLKALDANLTEMRDCAEYCRNIQSYKNGTKDKMERLLLKSLELLQSK